MVDSAEVETGARGTEGVRHHEGERLPPRGGIGEGCAENETDRDK